MSRKSVQRHLKESSDLAAILRIRSHELVSYVYYGWDDPRFQLRCEALARVFRMLDLKKSALNISADDGGNVHINFRHRGHTFCAVVKAEKVKEWQASIEAKTLAIEHRQPRIEGGPQLCLPAPR